MTWGRWPASGVGGRETTIPCPSCADGALWVRVSCLGVSSGCKACGARFEMSDLARGLDDVAFAELERLVGGRMSDRV